MIRSAPPASASLADRPVPAPAPMIGRPCATWPRSRRRASSRVIPVALRSAPCRRSAIAIANAGSLMSVSQLVHLDPVVEAVAQRPKESSSAEGSWKGCPSTAIIDTPRSGTKSAVGPIAAESFRPISRPSSRHRPPWCASGSRSGCGHEGFDPRTAAAASRGGRSSTISSAPSETTWGTPAAPAASSRSGPAESTPPTSSSASPW